MRSRSSQSGMTLLEVMVALTIFALLGVLSYRGLSGLMQARDHVSTATEHWLQAERLLQLVEADLKQLLPRQAVSADGTRLPALAIQKGEDDGFLRFVRTDALQGTMLVEYRWQGRRLQVSETAPDRLLATPEFVESIDLPLDDVAWEALAPDGTWKDQWAVAAENGVAAWPRALRLRFRMAGQTGDIVRVFALR